MLPTLQPGQKVIVVPTSTKTTRGRGSLVIELQRAADEDVQHSFLYLPGRLLSLHAAAGHPITSCMFRAQAPDRKFLLERPARPLAASEDLYHVKEPLYHSGKPWATTVYWFG